MEAGLIVGAIIGVVLATFMNAILIFIVGKLKLGMEVAGFGAALLAGLLVAVGSAIAALLWSLIGQAPAGGMAGALINLIVAAAILLAIGNALKGVTVKGWTGALVAAVAIAALSWLIGTMLTPVVAA